jgi:hypothetical protein
MNQHLIAFCYLFTIILLFFAFFIVRCLPPGRPLNIDLYRSNTIISLAIYNPTEFNKLDLDRVNQHRRLTPDQRKRFQSHVTSLTKHKSGKAYTPDSPYH